MHVTGSQIRPATTYRVQLESRCGVRSAPITVRTPCWGQVNTKESCADPAPSTDSSGVDALDVLALVDAYKNIFSGQTTFESADVWGSCATGPNENVDALDISVTIDAYRGYTFSAVCPSLPTCGTSAASPPVPACANPYRFTGRKLDLDFRDANNKPLTVLYDYRAQVRMPGRRPNESQLSCVNSVSTNPQNERSAANAPPQCQQKMNGKPVFDR